jgi:AcrR family transcriptional regulator
MPRKDAERNREKLVEAGRAVFAEQGPDASLEEVARRAGVGIGTLYRHFPTREALVEVIFEEHVAEMRAAAEDASAADDAWAGLVSFLERSLQLQADNLPLRDVFLRHKTDGDGRISEQRLRIGELLERAVARAREQGSVREDLALSDVLFALWSFWPLLELTAPVAPRAWRRHLQILLDGMRPEAATPQRVRPLGRHQLEAVIEGFRGRFHRRRAAA